jgi:hypothetical protein
LAVRQCTDLAKRAPLLVQSSAFAVYRPMLKFEPEAVTVKVVCLPATTARQVYWSPVAGVMGAIDRSGSWDVSLEL